MPPNKRFNPTCAAFGLGVVVYSLVRHTRVNLGVRPACGPPMTDPPVNFDDEFFAWLDRAAEELDIDFATNDNGRDPDIQQFEALLGFRLPQDLCRFYSRYTPWGVVREWLGWERSCETVKRMTANLSPLIPVDLRSYGSTGSHVFAFVQSPYEYEIVELHRPAGTFQTYDCLRSYYVAEVQREVDRCRNQN